MCGIVSQPVKYASEEEEEAAAGAATSADVYRRIDQRRR